MSITADNSWDTRDGFSMPHETRRSRLSNECQASILGSRNHKTARFPDSPDAMVQDSDDVGRLKSLNVENVSDTDDSAPWNRVIGMWLQWSTAYEQVSGRLFEDGENAQKLEALLDEMDQLRLEAVELSEGLLNY